MPSARRTIVIGKPPSDVFEVVADGTGAGQWRPAVLDATLVSGEGLGAVYRQGVKGPGGRRIAADYEVTAFEPPRRLAFRAVAGPVRPEGEYRLDPVPEGTSLTFSLNARLKPLLGLLMGRMVQRSMDGEMEALDRLKAVVEG